MKKILCLLLPAILLWGCTNIDSTPDNPISFYYISQEVEYAPGSSLIQELVVDGSEMGDSLDAILTVYLLGPGADSQLKSPFPSGTTLVGVSGTDDILYVTLSARFARLSGADLTAACACLAKTCFSLQNVNRVRIETYEATLDGAEYIEMTADSIVLSESGIPEGT